MGVLRKSQTFANLVFAKGICKRSVGLGRFRNALTVAECSGRGSHYSRDQYTHFPFNRVTSANTASNRGTPRSLWSMSEWLSGQAPVKQAFPLFALVKNVLLLGCIPSQVVMTAFFKFSSWIDGGRKEEETNEAQTYDVDAG